MKQLLSKTCLVCNKVFQKSINESLNCWKNRRKYCSKECANLAPRSKETRFKQRLAKLGKSSWNKGKKLSELHKMHLRKKHRPLSNETKAKMKGRRPWNKIGNGITPINERIRKSPEYIFWRKSVFERDNWTCVFCKKHGGNIQADHIKSFALYPKLRFVISNGRTLCIKCHRKTKSFGINQYTLQKSSK